MNSLAARILLAVCLFALLGSAAIFALSSPRWDPPPPLRTEVALSALEELLDAPVSNVDADIIAARPLLSASRRPPVAPVAEVPVPEPQTEPFPENVQLLGTYGAGGSLGVIVSQDDKAARVAVGSNWSGWKLQSVGADGASAFFVSDQGGAHVLRLRRQPQQGDLVYSPAERVQAAQRRGRQGSAPESGWREPRGDDSAQPSSDGDDRSRGPASADPRRRTQDAVRSAR